MHTITDCTQGLDLTAEHLAVAVRHAEANACGDLTSPWHSLAGQIRLIAGGVAPICDDDEPQKHAKKCIDVTGPTRF